MRALTIRTCRKTKKFSLICDFWRSSRLLYRAGYCTEMQGMERESLCRRRFKFAMLFKSIDAHISYLILRHFLQRRAIHSWLPAPIGDIFVLNLPRSTGAAMFHFLPCLYGITKYKLYRLCPLPLLFLLGLTVSYSYRGPQTTQKVLDITNGTAATEM